MIRNGLLNYRWRWRWRWRSWGFPRWDPAVLRNRYVGRARDVRSKPGKQKIAAKITVEINANLRGLTLICWLLRRGHPSVGSPRGPGAEGPRPRLSVRLLPEFVEGDGVTNIAVVRPLWIELKYWLYLRATRRKYIIDRPVQPAQRQTRNSLGRIATILTIIWIQGESSINCDGWTRAGIHGPYQISRNDNSI